MSKNFSAPRSAPKPASVTTTSPRRERRAWPRSNCSRGRCCRTGRRGRRPGPPSSVCTRLGRIASFRSSVIAPVALRSRARDRLRGRGSWPTMIRPRRSCRSCEVAGEAEDRHDLAGGNDDEALLAAGRRCRSAEADDHLAQRPVVHVDGARPGDAAASIRRSHSPAAGGCPASPRAGSGPGDRVEVAGEVEVDVLHRRDLRVSPPRGTALDAEDRSEARLTDGRAPHSCRAPQRLGQANLTVLFPSPDGVGEIPVTRTRPLGVRAGDRVGADLALNFPYGSSSSGARPRSAATSVIGRRLAPPGRWRCRTERWSRRLLR